MSYEHKLEISQRSLPISFLSDLCCSDSNVIEPFCPKTVNRKTEKDTGSYSPSVKLQETFSTESVSTESLHGVLESQVTNRTHKVVAKRRIELVVEPTWIQYRRHDDRYEFVVRRVTGSFAFHF